MIDIHNHFMPDVDDGSKSIEMSKELLQIASDQGVTTIFLTPHVNSSETRVSRDIHMKQYNALKPLAQRLGIDLYLGAEIYIPYRLPDLEYSTLTLGDSKAILIEFSPYMETPILDHAYNLKHRGFEVIIAHVERYNYLTVEDMIELKHIGVYLQVNASSVIKAGHPEHAKRARMLIKHDLIDFVASDSHNTTSRPPRLLQAYKELCKLRNESTAKQLLSDNQIKLLFKHN
ncbi:MAG: CpsB/CapC family capsule biosynthesis tyrosine phosphatase [Acholeplasmataceae bacterium]